MLSNSFENQSDFMDVIEQLSENTELSHDVRQNFKDVLTNFNHINTLFNNKTTTQIENDSNTLNDMVPNLLAGIHNLFQMIAQLADLPDDLTKTYQEITGFAQLAHKRLTEGPPKYSRKNMINYIKNNKDFFTVW